MPTEGLEWPRPTMSKACSSGTPAFIITASWRVKMVRSLAVIFLPPRELTFFTEIFCIPWRRSCASTMWSPAARSSPCCVLPDLSFALHLKL